jgi:hypothetical protein
MIALGLALFVQRSTYRRVIMSLKKEVQLAKSKNIFKGFMDVTFGDSGRLIVKDPQEIRLHLFSAGDKNIELDQSSSKDILSLFSADKGKVLTNEYGLKFYNEFTSESVDDQFSYFDPAPTAVLEFTRKVDRVFLFLGKEEGQNYAKVFVLDASKNRKNQNYKWFKFGSSLIDRIVGGMD